MAKNYAAIYASGNDSSALEQKFFIKQESLRGTLAVPVGTDFFFTIEGGTITYSQEFTSSPHRSGRHNNNIIKNKKVTEWSLPTYVNIDTAAAQGVAEVDSSLRLLWKSLLGFEDTAGGPVVYNASVTPSYTFSLFEIGDLWSRQSPGAFVNTCEVSLPGDGQSQLTWGGNAKTAYMIGISKITTAPVGNAVTVQPTEGYRFRVGGLVMFIDDDGVTRNADTPDGAPRTITAVTGDVVEVDGAALTLDGSVADVYICYYEPETAVAIDNPQTGLQGHITSSEIPMNSCVRSLTLSINNNHELVDYCFGEDGLAGPLFVPGGRLDVTVSMDINLSAEILELFNKVQDAEPIPLSVVLGDTASRHLGIELPRCIFSVPAASVPATGSIPVTFAGMAYQTANEAADEIEVSYN